MEIIQIICIGEKMKKQLYIGNKVEIFLVGYRQAKGDDETFLSRGKVVDIGENFISMKVLTGKIKLIPFTDIEVINVEKQKELDDSPS